MAQKITTIAFDADDTLWQNERFFRLTQEKFADLLSEYAESEHLMQRLLAAERRNIGRYGFGVKGFVLSMIETAIEVTDQRVPASVIQELLDAGQDMLNHPIHLLPHVEATLKNLAGDHDILLITKGDLLDQERKLAQSGLGDYFDGVEIVSEKSVATYQEILARRAISARAFMMVGNSLKSDVIPVLDAGGWAVYVPHGLTWELEHANPPAQTKHYAECADLSELEQQLHCFNTTKD
jgi:putative hydrolase of the HAD superfamily